jgi:hypothetical protein
MGFPEKRPIEIGIIPHENLAIVRVDSREDIPLKRVINKLNSLQTLFQYKIVNPPMSLDEYDLRHLYSDKIYFETMAHRIEKSPLKWAITIVSEELEDGSFNRHNQEAGFGVISVKHYKEYLPSGRNLDQYLAFLILCESFCLVSGQHLEHHLRKFCLFDICDDKNDLIECIRISFIHEACKTKIIDAGFKESDILEAEKILAFVRKPDTFYKINKFISSPLISLQIGIFLGLLPSLLLTVDLQDIVDN